MSDEPLPPWGMDANLVYCPHCDSLLERAEFEWVGMVPEIGNLPRYRCLKCNETFETLPPDVLPTD